MTEEQKTENFLRTSRSLTSAWSTWFWSILWIFLLNYLSCVFLSLFSLWYFFCFCCLCDSIFIWLNWSNYRIRVYLITNNYYLNRLSLYFWKNKTLIGVKVFRNNIRKRTALRKSSRCKACESRGVRRIFSYAAMTRDDAQRGRWTF